MPRGRPSGEQGSDPKTNKMAAVRLAMDSLGYEAPPLDIQQFVKDNFGQDIPSNMVSSYKSNIRKEAGLKSKRKKRGRPRKDEPATAVAATASSHDAVPWKDIRTIKDIAGRIGKKGLRELVELLD
ncbi:MAG TPA: hypothetical protein VN688_01795 [Gemmataceae bacterium]|nr:hypothetical protein [Gemmataceae bacterium]